MARLYLSLVGGNTATPGANVTKWQAYIQREATAEEALAGDGATQVMTPRRTKALASYLDDQLKTTITTALSPFILPVGAIVLWGNATPPSGWLELNGQAFNTGENPNLAALYPSGRVPDWRGRYIVGASDSNVVGALRAADWDHYHPVGQFTGNSGDQSDDARMIQERSIPRYSNNISTWGGKQYAYRLLTGDIQKLKEGAVPSAGSSSIDTGDQIATQWTGMHPADASAVYIIKTDKAEAETGAKTPSAVVVSPATVTLSSGTSRQFSGTVLPALLAGGFPVAWSVSDSTLGSINSSGLYTSLAGKSGMQTIIASISTGLTATATVTQQVYLTNISLGTAPSALLAGSSYSLPVTYSPATYTEMVNAASSDSSVAALAADGSLTVTGAGTTTLTLTGASSGVTASITVTATEVAAKEIYLQIADNLAEISSAGASAMQAARSNLGLKALATKDALSASDVGAVPQASTTLGTDDLNTITSPGA